MSNSENRCCDECRVPSWNGKEQPTDSTEYRCDNTSCLCHLPAKPESEEGVSVKEMLNTAKKLGTAPPSPQQEQGWEERFEKQFGDLTLGILSGHKNGPVFYNNELEVPRLKNFIRKEIDSARKEGFTRGCEAAVEKLVDYTEHTRDCVLDTFQAGRPTANGGYEQKYGGVWYEAKPIDKTPKCDCGLAQALKDITNKVETT